MILDGILVSRFSKGSSQGICTRLEVSKKKLTCVCCW